MTNGAGVFPPQSAFYYAILKFLATQPEGARRTLVHEAMPKLLGLTDEQRRDTLENMPNHPRYRHRSGWGLSMLKTGGYVDSPSRGVWCITERGKALLTQNPNGFDDATRRNVLRESRPPRNGTADILDSEASEAADQTPDERIDSAYDELRRKVASDLIQQILAMSPEAFERLVLSVLHGLGYGASEDDLQLVGGPGDGGIDGVVSLDRLGFEKIYVQAKRWQGPVGRPDIQGFYGALAAKQAKKGVFITSSTFTREAKEFAGHVGASVVLIDGERLTSLMIECGVGVFHYRTIRLPRIDMEFFDSD